MWKSRPNKHTQPSTTRHISALVKLPGKERTFSLFASSLSMISKRLVKVERDNRKLFDSKYICFIFMFRNNTCRNASFNIVPSSKGFLCFASKWVIAIDAIDAVFDCLALLSNYFSYLLLFVSLTHSLLRNGFHGFLKGLINASLKYTFSENAIEARQMTLTHLSLAIEKRTLPFNHY